LIERGQTNEAEDIRAVICDFGLAVTNQNINSAPHGFFPFFFFLFFFKLFFFFS